LYSSLWETHRRTTERHLPYGITQYLLPATMTHVNAPCLNPIARQASSKVAYPGGMEGWVAFANKSKQSDFGSEAGSGCD